MFVGCALSFDPTQYEHNITWNGIYNVHWRIEGNVIYLALDVNTTGWVGFGIAEQSSGTMAGSDIVQGYVSASGTAVVKDRYALSQFSGGNYFQEPITDNCQDWELIKGEEINGKTILEVSRKIDTGDSQDRPIPLGKNARVIMAYGDNGEDNFNYHQTRRKATVMNFDGKFNPSKLLVLKNDPDINVYDFRNNWRISAIQNTIKNQTNEMTPPDSAVQPDDVTVYTYKYLDLRPVMQSTGALYLYGIEHLISEHSAEYVHHFILDGFFMDEFNEDVNEVKLYAWAPGTQPQVTAPHCAFMASLNDSRGFNYLKMETHYDNPEKKEGYLDNSGIRMYYKTSSGVTQVPVQCGMLAFGQGGSGADKILPKGISDYDYDCPSSRTMYWDQPEITVLSNFLHMHTIGRQIWTELYRDGTYLKELDRIDFWDFNFQSFTQFESGEMTLKRGDRIKLQCIFDSFNEATKFGPASKDEMCIDYVLYYPRLGNSWLEHICDWDWTGHTNQAGGVQRQKKNLTEFTYTFGRTTTYPSNETCMTMNPTMNPTITMSSTTTMSVEPSSDIDTSSATTSSATMTKNSTITMSSTTTMSVEPSSDIDTSSVITSSAITSSATTMMWSLLLISIQVQQLQVQQL